jgi:serine protease Do
MLLGGFMSRKFIFCFIFIFIAGFTFGQTSALRDYVGMISQGFHPDIITFLQKLKTDADRKGYNAWARSLENFMKGDSGTGFVYVGSDGKNYILTNYHVISQAHTLTITFETTEGEKTKFSDLQIVAVDEDMDMALLAFAGGQNPFTQGLSLINRPVEEGEDVYSAGFPGAGSAMIWQLGRGIVSNASVRLPQEDENDKAIGPYIQHTAQVDGGNSGGPLLIQTPGVPTGYAVAGINTLSIRRRQAANYSIPVTRVRTFLEASMKPPAEDQRSLLEERVNEFIKGLSANKAVYPHIAQYLSNTCTGENAEYAINEVFQKATRTVSDNIFDRDTISSLTYSVAWTIENSLRSKSGAISMTLDSISPGEDGSYNVSFNVNGGKVDSIWINEYGIWRIRSFGTIASGDKTLVEKEKKAKADSNRLKDTPFFMISVGLAVPFDVGAALGADLTIKIGKYIGVGPNLYIGKDYTHIEMAVGGYYPIKIGSTVALTPFANGAVGIMITPEEPQYDYSWGYERRVDTPTPFGVDTTLGLAFRGGVLFTTKWVPGLFLQASYQYNIYNVNQLKDSKNPKWIHPNLMYIGVGYSF